MNVFQRSLGVIGFAAALVLAAVAPSHAGSGSAVSAVHAADDAWLKAYSGGKLDDIAALYDENAILYPPGLAPALGRAAIRTFLEKDMAEFAKTGFVLMLGDKPDGGVNGDLGWSSGTWTMKDKSGQIMDSGWYFSVSRKVGGKWLYVRDTWNSDKPATPSAAAN